MNEIALVYYKKSTHLHIFGGDVFVYLHIFGGSVFLYLHIFGGSVFLYLHIFGGSVLALLSKMDTKRKDHFHTEENLFERTRYYFCRNREFTILSEFHNCRLSSIYYGKIFLVNILFL